MGYKKGIAQSAFYIASDLHLVMELTCFGGLISGFIQQVEELGTKHHICSTEIVFEECTQLVACFRGLKKGFEPLLFILYSTNIFILTTLSYYVLLAITGKVMFILILMNIAGIMVPVSLLTYTALLADDGFIALKDTASVLRLTLTMHCLEYIFIFIVTSFAN